MSITFPRGIEDASASSAAYVVESSHASRELRPGARVGRYELRERLGQGGMGVVYAAWDPELDRRVAIKLVRRSHAVSPELLRRRLRREAQAMARLRHPNVVAVYDVGEVEGQLFVAMEYVAGVSLRKWLQLETRSVAEILAVFRAAGEGLAAAHAEGVIHRDFKPDNVLVTRDGKALVLDFGLASWATSPGSDPGRDAQDTSDDALREAEDASPHSPSDELDESGLTRPGSVLGTLNYMAPEQRRGRAIDARADQYGFCVALWQALSGELPYGSGASSRSLARARVGRLSKIRKDVPIRVERALGRGLAWHPDERWPDMRALLDALAPSNSRQWWWAGITTALAATAIVLALVNRDSEPAPVCESSRVSAVWNDSVANSLSAALAGRGELARRSWPYVQDQLNRWAASWTAVDLELCDRYGGGAAPELHERQLLCLDRQLEHFAIATDLLGSASAEELEHSFDLLARLPDPTACRATSIVGVAADVSAQELSQLEKEVERLELEVELGRLAQADAASAELLTATRTPGLESLHVRVAVLRDRVLCDLERREEAIDVAFAGLAAAERDGGPALRLQAFTNLVYTHVNTQDLQGAKRWLTQADAIAQKQELDRALLHELASTEALVNAVDGRLLEAIAGFDRALALMDPATEQLDRATLMISRAQLFGYLGQPEVALAQFVIAERELVKVIGPEHPEMLDARNAKALIQLRLEQWEPARTELLAVANSLDALRGQPTALSVSARGHAAWALSRLGDCEGALAEFEPLIPLARAHMAYPSPDLGKLLTERAQLCDYATEQSVEFAREALALYREAVGDQHVMIAGARELLARAHFEAGELQPAREQIEAALTIYAAVAPIGVEKLPEAEALQMLIRHALGERGALDGRDELLARLPDHSLLAPRLAALP